MTVAAVSFLDALKAAADQAEAAEVRCRQETAKQLALVERERVFAFRRLNLMRAVANAMAQAEEVEVAVAEALAAVRAKIGWASDSDARAEVTSRFAPVARAVFQSATQSDAAPATSAQAALAEFENWYAGSHQKAFWDLFEQYVMETPRVDF